MPSKNIRILWATQTTYHFHYYRSTITELVRRGHTVRLLADQAISKTHSSAPIESFAREHGSFTYGWLHRRTGLSRGVLRATREMRSFRRFLCVSGQSTHYQDRWLNIYFPYLLRGIFKYIPGTKRVLKTGIAGMILEWIEQIIPPVSSVKKDIQDFQPDVVVVGPGNIPYPEDVEYIKAAKVLGVPTITPIFSWDNLTTKEIFHVAPDLLLVWNEAQVGEVAEHHANINTDHVRIVGGAQFDQWFKDLKPSTSREEFCKAHGLRAEDPILLYLGTTRKFSVDEVSIIRDVKKLLNSSRAPLNHIQVIVRPHPENAKRYEAIDEKKEGVRIIPRGGQMPNTESSFQLYFDTLFHSTAIVVGVHTSALIESCIMNKPLIVLTHRTPKHVQSDVQHFQQFLRSGALELAASDEEFTKILHSLLNGHDGKKGKREAFVKSFVRPYGLDVSAGERAAEEIEQFANMHSRHYEE